MDERLKEALSFSNLMVTLDNQKRILKEQYQDNLIYYFNGAQFTITQSLISFCQSLIALHQTETILIDDNDIPVMIDDLEKFASSLVSSYWKAANKYLTEYNKLKINKTIEGIINLNE